MKKIFSLFIALVFTASYVVVFSKHSVAASAPTFVSSSTCSTGSISCTINVSPDAGHLMFLWYVSDGGQTSFNISDTAGNTFATANAFYSNSNFEEQAFYAVAAATGSDTITCTRQNNNGVAQCYYAEFSGVSASPLDQAAASTASTVTPSVNTSVANELIIGHFSDGFDAFTAAGGYTSIYSTTGQAGSGLLEYTTVAAAGSYNATAATSASSGVHNGIVTFEPASSGGTDTQAPTVPTNLTATSTSSSTINLSWTASTDNVGVTGYKIYRNSTQIGTSATNSYSDTGLSASTLYTYTVSAYDAAGNNSAQSTSTSGTTQAQQTVTGSNIYLAQTAAGSANGADCSDALAVSFFNTSSNWAATPTSGKISPGTTVHLCGVFTAPAGSSGYLTFQGSGASGNPVTLLFESGAILQAPYWGANGAIYISGKSYVTIDGSSSGLIQATLNGSAGGSCPGGPCTYQQGVGAGVYLSNAINTEVKNLTVGDLYDHSSISDTTGSGNHQPWGITVWGGSNITVDHNTIHDVNWGINIAFYPGFQQANLNFSYNTIYNVSLGIGGGDGTSGGTVSNVLIYNNIIHDMENWDVTGDANHHDGIYIWITNAPSSFTGPYVVYNNLIYNLGNYCSTAIYFDPGATTNYPNATAFNNVINAGSGCGDGSFYDKSGKMRLYNNTIVGGSLVSTAGSATQIFENNLTNQGMWFTNPSISTSDYNDWYQLNNPAIYYSSTYYSTLSAYATATGFDAHSIITNPSLSSTYQPQTGSPLIAAGTNLYSVCSGQPNPGLGALCYDAAGNARPSSGPWDIGAYQSSSGSNGTPILGDINLDHIVNSLDYSAMNSHWFQNYSPADLNSDSIVNSLDFAILKSNWGKTW